MTTHLAYEGQLVRAWSAKSPTHAEAYVPPFNDDLDFDSYRLMAPPSSVRAHVTYPDHYTLLLAILEVVHAEAGNTIDEILINSRMPSVERIPGGFFGRNILFVNDVQTEAERIATEGTCVLAINEKFLRHTVEAADNSLKLQWWNPPQDASATLDRIAANLAPLGIVSAERWAA